MNLKGIACGFVVVGVLAASIWYGTTANINANPVVNAKFGNSALLPSSTLLETRPPKLLGADAVGFYGQSLMSTSDASQRMELVRQLGTAASRDSRVGVREPQAVEILGAAYSRETDRRVKIAILNAVSNFTVAEAAEILNRGLEDSDSAVRETAQHAKHQRELRLWFVRCCE